MNYKQQLLSLEILSNSHSYGSQRAGKKLLPYQQNTNKDLELKTRKATGNLRENTSSENP